MRLKINISPCPNDTFMFHALLHGLVDTRDLEFDVQFADIEELNRMAMEALPDVSKVSYGAYPLIAKHYELLTSGSALGFGVGPLVVAKQPIEPAQLAHCRVALPGEHTTANLLFTSAFPQVAERRYMLFSDIEAAVLRGEVDAGVIIHESRFTYAERGLHRVLDLGQWWEQRQNMPVPLGGIVVRRSLPIEVKRCINQAVRQSVEMAMAQPQLSAQFVAQHAQEMSADVQRQHIGLYVNKHSVNLDEHGRLAIQNLVGERVQNVNLDHIFIDID